MDSKDLLTKLEYLYTQKQSIENEISILERQLSKKFSKDDRIAIFRELFVGREDIYAKEWFNDQRTKRYFYPVTKTFKGEDYLPLTNEVLELHLRGETTLATYPINGFNKSKYLVIKSTKEFLKKIAIELTNLNIDFYIEKNYYGDFHVWIFFENLVNAKDVISLSKIIFQKIKINLPIYPNKDYVTPSDFGTALELPLQLIQRQNGKTVFCDIEENEINDIWSYLSRVRKLSIKELYNIINRYKIEDVDETSDYVFESTPINIVLKDKIYIEYKSMSKKILNYLKSIVSFENPQVQVLLRLKKPLYNIQRIIKDFEEDEKYLILPRGVIEDIKNFFDENNAKYIIDDQRYIQKAQYPKIKFILREEQNKAIKNILKNDCSICVAPPGFGKTLIGAKMIEQRGVNTLVIVNKNMLLEQWIERFVNYFEMDKKDIGFLGKGKNKLNKKLDIATMQSLKNSIDIIKDYSFVIVDECHHIPAYTFETIIKTFQGKYALGLSATPNRKDGLEKILFHQLGKISYEHKAKKSKNNIVKVYKSEFVSENGNFSELLTQICNDINRNKLIVSLIKEHIKNKILILTDRVEHINILNDMLLEDNIIPLVIHGGLNKKDQDEAMVKANDSKLIIATTSFFGEGIDFAHLDTIVFATPISFYGRLIQYLGRVGRGGSDSIAIDILDNKHAMLNSSFVKRKEGYKQMHYKIKFMDGI